jgi:hypothetical protein
VQACWNRNRRRRNGCNRSLSSIFATGLQHCFGHFLDEQRNAIGAFDDVLSDVRWQRPIAGDAVDQGIDFALPEPVECEGGDVRASDPRRLKLRPVRNN